jgi:hypothetical protein
MIESLAAFCREQSKAVREIPPVGFLVPPFIASYVVGCHWRNVWRLLYRAARVGGVREMAAVWMREAVAARPNAFAQGVNSRAWR